MLHRAPHKYCTVCKETSHSQSGYPCGDGLNSEHWFTMN
jgi:hypothetical protein